jgi:hypothetical protein
VVALEADHSGVCKFGDNETGQDNFDRVLGNIQDLVENALKIRELSKLPSVHMDRLLDSPIRAFDMRGPLR